MVARRFLVRFHDAEFDVDYDIDHGLEAFKFQVFSLTSIPPEEQKIFGSDDDRLVSDDSDLASISDRLRVVSIADEVEQGEKSVDQNAELARLDEDLVRRLQAEEAALVRIKEEEEEEEEEALMPQQKKKKKKKKKKHSCLSSSIRSRISSEEGWISLGPWGELCGEEYWDYKPDGPIMQITIGYGYAINSVLFESKTYDGIVGSFVKVSGTDGDGRCTKTFCIDSSVEQLSSISLTYGLNYASDEPVISLCFETNRGNKYGPFGEGTGDHSLSIPIQGGVITGFHGRASVDTKYFTIGIFVAPKVNSLPCSRKKVDSLHSIQDSDSGSTYLKGKGKISEEEGWISLGPWGGKDGVDWVYKPDGPIMQISICYAEAINSILFESKSSDGFVIGSSEKIGGTGGDKTVTFSVDSSVEQLSSIRLTYGDCNGQVAIISLCFITNLKKYGPFGLGSGPSSVSIPIEGGVLVGFHGRLGNDITAIGIIVAPKNNSLHSVQDPDSALSQLKGKISDEEGWISVGPWGELRRHKYWAYKPEGPIMQITISYGHAIDSILFKSKSSDGVFIGSSVKVGGTGGDGRWTKTFCIDSSVEQLSSISLTYEFVYFGAIISICFETNIGIKYGPFGERTGDYSLSIPIEGGVITGFHGLAGDGSWLYAIGIFVAPKVNSLPCSGKKVDSLHSIQDPDSGSTYLKDKGKISEEEEWISLGPWGGKDGEDWVYKPNGPILQISICYGEAVNSILFRSRSCDGFVIGSSEKIGGIGGDTTETFCIDSSEEQLSSISMTYKDYNGQTVITSLCFETNGKKYGPFGTTSDDARKPAPDDIYSVTIPGPSSLYIPIEGGVIVGFHGRGGTYLTAIGIFVASKVNNLPSSEKKFKSLVSDQDPDYAATQRKEKAKAKALTICEGKENAAPKVKEAVELSKGKGKAIYVDKGKETVAHQPVSGSGVGSKLKTFENIIIHNTASSSANTNKADHHGGAPSPSSEINHSAASSSATTNKDDHHAGAPSPSFEKISMNLDLVDSTFQETKTHMDKQISEARVKLKQLQKLGGMESEFDKLGKAIEKLKVQIPLVTNKDDNHDGALSPTSKMIHSDLILMDTAFAESKVSMYRMNEKSTKPIRNSRSYVVRETLTNYKRLTLTKKNYGRPSQS